MTTRCSGGTAAPGCSTPTPRSRPGTTSGRRWCWTTRPRRILETALYCDRLAETAAFYQRLLEPVVLLSTDRLVALDAGEGTVLLLFQRGKTITPLATPGGTVPPHDGSPTGHLAFAIDRDQVAPWEAKLRSLGIPIESRVRWERGGESLYFRDPDGRSVEIATPGLWASY